MIFPDIESYIEFLAGYRSPNHTALNTWSPRPVIQLANYDTSFVNSVAEQTMTLNTPMSDRQAGLAEKLVEKYARQMRKYQVDQPDHKNYRLGVRAIDRSSGLSLAEGKLHFKFAFDNALITQIKAFAKDSQGAVAWDKDLRVWTFALTEYNLSWVATIAQAGNIFISAEVRELFDMILEAEKTSYGFDLRYDDEGKWFITNAPTSMIEYIEAHGGFDDVVSLMDLSGMLGFTVNDEIKAAMTTEYGAPFVSLCNGQTIEFTPDKYTIDDIINWAKTVNRFPICVVNPNLAKVETAAFEKHFAASEIYIVPRGRDPSKPFEVAPGVKLVYTTSIPRDWQGRVPLLISYANLMHGTTKRNFMGLADKVVYYCEKLPTRKY